MTKECPADYVYNRDYPENVSTEDFEISHMLWPAQS